MKLEIKTPAELINKAYLQQSPEREALSLFKTHLVNLYASFSKQESEEHQKINIRDFQRETWYQKSNLVNTSDRIDLAIYSGPSASHAVSVIIETKAADKPNEMMTRERPNTKAFHELVLYYLREFDNGNHEVKNLIVTNTHEWFVFDGVWFEKNIGRNAKLMKAFRALKTEGRDTTHFYESVAKPWLENLEAPIPCCWFDLREYQQLAQMESIKEKDNKRQIALYKLLSPQHLLKLPFSNDSNSLNKEFYSELLHIMGLEEIKEKGKKLIRRKAQERRNEGSLLENTINLLKVQQALDNVKNFQEYGCDEEEQYFSVALELCITWLNRILFLKLLEGRLIAWNRGDTNFAFLNKERIKDFDELQELFFEVLARQESDRTSDIRNKFGTIPYLNSSLFEISFLEKSALQISSLKQRLAIPLSTATVLKNDAGKRRSGESNTLFYLFDFLDAYDFASEGKALVKETPKTIINASVLGLIFEKINGYRDGSFYTPGYITMYMSRQSIRRAVLQKFNEHYGWSCQDFIELHNGLARVSAKEANDIVNSLKICDPAVGSGHFLVSALNEILTIKAELQILIDKDGKLLRDYAITVDNDELQVMDGDSPFVYTPGKSDSQRVQETLFNEKAAIIENCLFGVDINPKSVAICRLRLWIELLKNAYYRDGAQLETLPNIDINIKCGNSLVSRFSLDDNSSGLAHYAPVERRRLKDLTRRYKEKVWCYKLGEKGPSNKGILRREIEAIKEQWRTFSLPSDYYMKELLNVKNELAQAVFAFDEVGHQKREKLHQRAGELEEKIDARQQTVYANAFEWRFEFPEVLDEEGAFTGFDVVIGNPPYIRQEAIKEQKPVFSDMFGSFFCGTADIYTYFYKMGLDLTKAGALLCYIAPNKFMRAGYGKNTRELLTTGATPLMVLDFGDLPVFDEATTYPSIVMVEKCPPSPQPSPSGRGGNNSNPRPEGEGGRRPGEGGVFAATLTDPKQLTSFADTLATVGFTMPISALRPEGWTLERPEVLALMDKLRRVGTPLGEYVEGKFYYGIKTGLNEAFVIDWETRARLIAEDPNSAEIIKPWLRGRDIKKWQAEWAGLYIVAIASSGNREWPWSREISEPAARQLFEHAYPAIYKHLCQWETGLKKRDDQGRFWWELRSCIYYGEFDRPKIMYAEISTEGRFILENKGYLSDTTSFIMACDSKLLLAILNSKLFTYVFSIESSSISGGFFRWKRQYMENIPIPPASDAQKTTIIELVEKILAVPDSPDIPRFEAEIDRLVYALYGLTDAEIGVVEGKS